MKNFIAQLRDFSPLAIYTATEFAAIAAAMFNDLSSLPAYLSTRRSGKARDLIAPGPGPDTMHAILQMAARTPDHGKLFPWRFVTIDGGARRAFADLLAAAFRAVNPDARPAQIDAATAMAAMAPALVVLIYAPQPTAKIPAWEQQLSVGAAAMNLLHAVHAHGFAGNWITGWATYHEMVRAALCAGTDAADTGQIAGFFFIGTPALPLEERPRPEMSNIVSAWSGAAK